MQTGLRSHIYPILEIAHSGHRLSRIFDVVLILLIALNVMAVILESVDSLSARYGEFFSWFEFVSVIIFSIEYVLRVWSCVEHEGGEYKLPLKGRIRYMLTPMALIDLLAIAPFYLGILIPLDLRFIRALRLLRIFKLTRYFSALDVLLSVLKDEGRAFGAALFVLIVILIIASSGIYMFEHEAQPQAFGSIPAAMWWAVATLTTVGYGDVTPITVGGKLFGACITVVGIGMVALPAGILASGFSEHLHTRQEEYGSLVDEACEDGVLTAEEQYALEKSRLELGLSREDAERIFMRVARDMQQHRVECPHCNQ